MPIGRNEMPIVRYTAKQLRRRNGRVNWKILNATAEEDIARHAEDDSSTEGEDFRLWRKVIPLDVAAIRAKTKLSQVRFARAFQISPHTLRNWEQGRRVPEGPARVLLTAIDRDPRTMLRLLKPEAAARAKARRKKAA
jgi:putative transcriptional regulator